MNPFNGVYSMFAHCSLSLRIACNKNINSHAEETTYATREKVLRFSVDDEQVVLDLQAMENGALHVVDYRTKSPLK
jgi:hypothetical protein